MSKPESATRTSHDAWLKAAASAEAARGRYDASMDLFLTADQQYAAARQDAVALEKKLIAHQTAAKASQVGIAPDRLLAAKAEIAAADRRADELKPQYEAALKSMTAIRRGWWASMTHERQAELEMEAAGQR